MTRCQELLGHKRIRVALRFTHLAPQHQPQAVHRLWDTELAPGPLHTKTDTDVCVQPEVQTERIN